MSLAETKHEVEYPETDGQPLGETELHIDWTIRLRDILKQRYRGQQVYVGADMFVYYVEGEPYRNVCPDVFVVLDCDPHIREIYKVWEEGKPPTVVFEITSKGTRKEDELQKPPKYALIGVEEYFLYDPKGEYLHPPLAGYRRQGTDFQPIERNSRGALECTMLGITLELDGNDLAVRDAVSGEALLTSTEASEAAHRKAEAQRQKAETERQKSEAERQKAEAEWQKSEAERQKTEAELTEARAAQAADRARIAELEAELERLRRQRGDSTGHA